MRILVINPGSTSTKIAVYEDEKPLLLRRLSHKAEEIAGFPSVFAQKDFRLGVVLRELAKGEVDMNFNAVIGRGGLARALPGGVYEVDEQMCADVQNAVRQHVCNLGCIIAYEIARTIAGCRAFIADPSVVDELEDEARISGSPLCPRVPVWHALNQRAIARRYAREHGKRYEDLNLIVCHMGGGTSVAAHRHGRAVSVNNALDGEGPFSPERAGTLPAADLVRLCFSGRFTQDELLHRIAGEAGLAALLGTTDVREIVDRIEHAGDERAKFYLDAMIYHTAKAIAAEGAVLEGDIDSILLTGGVAHSEYVTSRLRRRIAFLAPVHVYPGEDEMQALALNALEALRGRQEVKKYGVLS